MNKCPNKWRLTYNLQNQNRTTKHTNTHYQEIIEEEKRKEKKMEIKRFKFVRRFRR